MPVLSGRTELIAHLGFPTETFKSPMIYNPWFEAHGIDAAVVPMGIEDAHYAAFFGALFRLTNIRGALVTMPHKVTTLALVDEIAPSARIAGACNAVLKRADGSLLGEQFDGEGFVRAVRRRGLKLESARVLVKGAGGVGSAIAAALAAARVRELALDDTRRPVVEAVADRLREHHGSLRVETGPAGPEGYDLVVNATPLGMRASDPLPFDVARIASTTLVADVVMKAEYTPLLQAARAKGCTVQVGTDMLFEMIPAYLEFFGFGTATADELKQSARLQY